jgi:hypothetical protein
MEAGEQHHRSALFRSINKAGRVWGSGMTPKVLWEVVREAATRAGIEKLAPHGLRRTCARLCHLSGGELDLIQVDVLSRRGGRSGSPLVAGQFTLGSMPIRWLTASRNFCLHPRYRSVPGHVSIQITSVLASYSVRACIRVCDSLPRSARPLTQAQPISQPQP